MPERAAEALESLTDEALVDAEARREGVVLDAETLRAATAAYVEDRRKDARVQYGSGTEFDALLEARYGRGLAQFTTDAERLVRTTLLCDRLARLDQFRDDGVEVRVLVLADQDAARDAAERLRGGADLERLAERAGARRPAAPPPLRRGEIPEKEVEARLFAARPGDVLDPVAFDSPSGVFWQVFKVTRAWKGSAATWEEIGPRVLESIRAVPVADDERAKWRLRAMARQVPPNGDAAKDSVRPPAGR